MFEQVLPGAAKKILARLGESGLLDRAVLGGGTALALRLGHRISCDLDFFTREEFDEILLLPRLAGVAPFELERTAWRTILGGFGDIRFSLFYYDYPLLSPPDRFQGIDILNIPDIAAMKIAAIASRGVKRDFVDLYFICRGHLTLDEVLNLYEQKYGNLAATGFHILKSLTYFDDAEDEEIPRMLKDASWKRIKDFFRREIRRLTVPLLDPDAGPD
ncbi:MAG: nucleotidyl transferase AbiEii/AbiGii toxin family protein [Candidatus Erginobacter occultus]|nr:nucleotidyl transferase AbiEii/AbiGii toxin family protein [Candidatus Erginobacter occultus]